MNNTPSSSQLNCRENENKEEEWPGYRTARSKVQLGKPTPLLIMELHRLQLCYDESSPHLHVLNMPDVRVPEIEIVGTLRKIYARSRLDLIVDDGTGAAQVLYSYDNLQKVKEERKNIDAKFSRLEKVAKLKKLGPNRIKDLEKQWLKETQNGTLGRRFEIFQYLHIIGTIYMDFGYCPITKKHATVENAKFGKTIVKAKVIYHLNEKEYNEKLQSWILGVVRDRYQKH